jgi:hypothetical protein
MRLVFVNGQLMEEGPDNDYVWDGQYSRLLMNWNRGSTPRRVRVVQVDEVPIGPYTVRWSDDPKYVDDLDELQDEFDVADIRQGLQRALLRGIEIGRAQAARNE